jgi:hypothetical protein
MVPFLSKLTHLLSIGKPRGFGFVIMAEMQGIQSVLDASPHFLEGKLVGDFSSGWLE